MSALYTQLIEAVSEPNRHLAPPEKSFQELGSKLIRRISPVRTLSLSLSDYACQQQCAHCNGHYLKGMTTFSTLAAKDLSNFDAVLISGGSNKSGAVDFSQHILEILNLPEHLKINLHPGFQPPDNLAALSSRAPMISFDLPGSNEVIRNVFKLPYSVEDYRNLFLSYARSFRAVPHITIGLNAGAESGETATIDFLANNSPVETVFIIFRPTPDTELANAQPPTIELVIKTLIRAKQKLNCPVKLGCMRPAGAYRRDIDILSWLHGIDKIVHPDHQLLQILQNNSVTIMEDKNCCALGS